MGEDGQEHAIEKGDFGPRFDELVAHAAGGTGVQGLVVKRIAQSDRVNLDSGPAHCEERAEIAGLAAELGESSDDHDFGVANARRDVKRRECW